MRQAGIIAAAGSYVLENNVQRLAEDHEHAAILGQELAKIPQLEVDLDNLHTNMVFLKSAEGDFKALSDFLEKRGILIDARYTARLVCHLDISHEDVMTTISSIEEFYK